MDKAAYGAEKKSETNVPELHTVEDVYEWIDKNIEYGWLGQDGKAHICEMKDFRRQYRTMSVSQTIQQKIGTCIEQVALMHELLDTIEVSNQMYCCRIYDRMTMGIWRRMSICTASCCISRTAKHITWSIRM